MTKRLIKLLEDSIAEIDRIHKTLVGEHDWGQWTDLQQEIADFILEYQHHFPDFYQLSEMPK